MEDFVTPPGAMPGCNDVASANDQNALGMLGELTLALIAAGALRGEHEGGAMEESSDDAVVCFPLASCGGAESRPSARAVCQSACPSRLAP